MAFEREAMCIFKWFVDQRAVILIYAGPKITFPLILLIELFLFQKNSPLWFLELKFKILNVQVISFSEFNNDVSKKVKSIIPIYNYTHTHTHKPHNAFSFFPRWNKEVQNSKCSLLWIGVEIESIRLKLRFLECFQFFFS